MIWTPGAIAKETGASIFRVQYLLKARNIVPIARAGRVRVFSEADARRVIAELRGEVVAV